MEFQAWPKTTRLFRDVVITEKIDGTNAAIHISAGYEVHFPSQFELKPGEAIVDGRLWRVGAQSRKRLITPDSDNFGFARWVYDNAAELVDLLGEGIHFGEWWGQGVQRNYGQDGKRFSLFNTARFDDLDEVVAGIPVRPVPVLYEDVFDQQQIEHILYLLRVDGSVAAPGFLSPEGICIFHTQSRIVQKVTLDNEDKGKWEHE